MENEIYNRCFMFLCFLIVEVSTECDTWIAVSVQRTVLKQGFHRELVSNVSWVIDNGDKKIDCDLLLVHHIPREIFVDLDEIKSLDSSSAKTVPLGETNNFDVERPAHLSSRQNVLVYPTINMKPSHWEVTSSSMLPVHWRYQQPTQNQYYVAVRLPRPTILAKCKGSIPGSMQECVNKVESVQYPCHHHTVDICDWFVLKQNINSKNDDIIFAVPVGTKKHAILVACGTIFVTLSASLILMQLPWLEMSKKKTR